MKIGFLGLLALLFIGLKLAGVIDWSWWYILMPLWGPAACFAGIFIVCFGIGIGISMLPRQRR